LFYETKYLKIQKVPILPEMEMDSMVTEFERVEQELDDICLSSCNDTDSNHDCDEEDDDECSSDDSNDGSILDRDIEALGRLEKLDKRHCAYDADDESHSPRKTSRVFLRDGYDAALCKFDSISDVQFKKMFRMDRNISTTASYLQQKLTSPRNAD
jgi:hypothetical protein